MAVFMLTSDGTTILSKTTVSVFIDEMGGFVLVTAPPYKFILKKKKKFKKNEVFSLNSMSVVKSPDLCTSLHMLEHSWSVSLKSMSGVKHSGLVHISGHTGTLLQ
jgi:hypothetical protein